MNLERSESIDDLPLDNSLAALKRDGHKHGFEGHELTIERVPGTDDGGIIIDDKTNEPVARTNRFGAIGEALGAVWDTAWWLAFWSI